MARNVLFFHLTRPQAAALLKLERGERIAGFIGTRGRPYILQALRARGLLDADTLTPLGVAAAQLVRALEAKRSAEDLAPAEDLKAADSSSSSSSSTPAAPGATP